MIISEPHLSSIYLNQVRASNALIAGKVPTSSFSAMLDSAIVNQSILTQEVAAQNSSDTSCDDEEVKKCKCERDDEVTENKKTGLAACMDCVGRKAGTCALWNGKEDMFDLLVSLSQNTSKDMSISLPHNQSYSQTDFVLMTQALLDYTNAYAYAGGFVNRRNLGI
ncbi:hypothetical protein [Agathobaculum desmolans]|uniref:hypothetical protein n=1 Tax=Agathobaculum desmolans TaxID=39484 RepID=UPI0004E14450|nr:hypothetical protein [Agathobaculum desmolans]